MNILGIWDIFNSNLTIISTIVNNYEFINIPYYIHLASNLDTYKTGILLVLGSISGTTHNNFDKVIDFKLFFIKYLNCVY